MDNKIQYFEPEKIVINPALSVRKAAPDKKKVEELVDSYFSRVADGMEAQIEAGRVRVLEDGTVELLGGHHRLAAVIEYNKRKPKSAERLEFAAVAAPYNDRQALVTAVQENWHVPSSLWDQAEAMNKLKSEPLNMTNKEIGELFHYSDSTVQNVLAVGKLNKRYLKMAEEGKLTKAFLFDLARYGGSDSETQDKIFQIAQENQERLGAAIQESEDEGEEAEASSSKSKSAKASKTAPKSDATNKAKSKKMGASDVKRAAAKLGLKKKDAGDSGKSRKQFLTFLESIAGEKVSEEAEVPEPILDLAEVLEGWFDNEKSDLQLRNAFYKCCKEEYVTDKPKTRKTAA